MNISIVVPFQNTEQYIEDCIGALLAQNYSQGDYEIIMIDNNSTDRSVEIVRRYSEVRLLSEAKTGSYATRNRGITESRGKIIAFTDSDCTPSSDWLNRIWEVMCNPEVCLVQGRQRFASDSLGLSILSDYEAEKAAYTFYRGTKEIYYGYTGNMAVHRDVFDNMGLFSELQRGADTVLVHRIIEKFGCESIRYAPHMCVRHLEVTNVWKWFKKMHIYARSLLYYRNLVQCRPLCVIERIKILRATIRRGGYSMFKSLLSILLLSIGLLYYEFGCWGSTNNMAQ
jgi:glycosyltransferase involved in cell wall biosynthesis